MAADLSSDDKSGVYAGMQTELGPISAIKCRDSVHHFKGRTQGAFGIVLMCHRRTKQRHNFVADEFINRPIVFLHHRHQPVEAGVD